MEVTSVDYWGWFAHKRINFLIWGLARVGWLQDMQNSAFSVCWSWSSTGHGAVSSHVNEGTAINLSVCGRNGWAQSWVGCGEQDRLVTPRGSYLHPPGHGEVHPIFGLCARGWGRERATSCFQDRGSLLREVYTLEALLAWKGKGLLCQSQKFLRVQVK